MSHSCCGHDHSGPHHLHFGEEHHVAASRFVYVTYIRTTPEKLWDALTKPEFTRQYWANTHQESEWKKDSPWAIMIPDGRVGDSGKIVEIEPPKRLVIDWQNQFVESMKDEGVSRLTYVIYQVGDTVQLTLTHEMDRPHSQLIEAVSHGWPHILASLKSLLETGKSLEGTDKWPEEL
jgi:uncharacterized protein YndB with AHSA1/START domain